MAVDNDGTQDRAADYAGEVWERAANNYGIKHRDEESNVVFDNGGDMVQVYLEKP